MVKGSNFVIFSTVVLFTYKPNDLKMVILV